MNVQSLPETVQLRASSLAPGSAVIESMVISPIESGGRGGLGVIGAVVADRDGPTGDSPPPLHAVRLTSAASTAARHAAFFMRIPSLHRSGGISTAKKCSLPY
jgi:hypothetical protein